MLESFVAFVYSNLLEMSNVNSAVSRNFFIKGLSGVIHEFDVYYDFFHLNIIFRVAIECKDWKHPVDKGKVQEFWSKISDLNNIAGVMIAKNGYQSGAIEFAKAKGITLLTVEDLPTLNDILAKRIEYLLLPDENTKGEPFWTIMQVEDGRSKGIYFNINQENHPEIPLFYSKTVAEQFLERIIDKENWMVFGLSQVQLQTLINLSKDFSKNGFAICFLPFVIEDQLQFISVDWKILQENYCLSN